MSPRTVPRERRHVSAAPVPHRAGTYYALLVINGLCHVRSTFAESSDLDGVRRFLRDGATRLVPEIESAVLPLISTLEEREDRVAGVAVLNNGSALRLTPLLDRPARIVERLYALVIEIDRNLECIRRAVSRYRLTNRQTDVLLHVLEGANASEVARALQISEYTAQGYIKTLLTKTNSRNRTAMVAKVLEWTRPQREPEPAAGYSIASVN